MMDKNERRICWYSSPLIAPMVNSPKLLALRKGIRTQKVLTPEQYKRYQDFQDEMNTMAPWF
ncbi:hypothetical protein DCC81_16510 [Chitinophaga parva]|uniref:Uncharacterized protein n=1 Tax=Chitinophaga parva TaxID=2169414 RepID=A0A2T7BHU5_9BACT|nr:hypothetical protein DCC81_16510 [Chitinophaga parva]